MYSRPRRLFQEIGHRTGANWLRQPRSQMILATETAEPSPAVARETLAQETPLGAHMRLQ
jgi:hypothetical protein